MSGGEALNVVDTVNFPFSYLVMVVLLFVIRNFGCRAEKEKGIWTNNSGRMRASEC